jgi:hypothetical protein
VQQQNDHGVVSVNTAATKVMRKRGKSSPTEEAPRGIPSADHGVVSVNTAATKVMRKRGKSSPTEEAPRGIPSADQSVHATARAMRKRRGVCQRK